MNKRIGPRMNACRMAVECAPGNTAHFLARICYGSRRPAWGRVYEAFRRAAAAGLIRAERRGKMTVYFPA